MAQDVAKLLIVVGSKGAEKTSKDLDKVTTSSKGLASQTKKTLKEKDKFATTINKVRASLAPTAAAVYLLRGAYNFLSGTVEDLTNAYEEQFSAEIKLQTILKSTEFAIGRTYDQVYELAQAWQDLTGVNDAVILNAAGIAATFTQIQKEVFPQVIEQALNMSTIFGQDMKQSIIQLGTALNDPIRGLGRLRRIGISFSEEQKELTKSLTESGDILGAQTVIIDELEREIGQVARAMGETSLGAIKKYETAWQNLKEELGEGATTLKANLLEITGITDGLNDLNEILSEINAADRISDLFDAGILDSEITLAQTRLQEFDIAYEDTLTKLLLARDSLKRAETQIFGRDKAIREAQELVDYYEDLAVAIINARVAKIKLDEESLEVDDEVSTPSINQDDLDAFLKKLEDLRRKSEISGLSEYQQQVVSLNFAWKDLAKTADEFGLTEEELREATSNYFDVMLANLNKEIQEEERLKNKKKERLEAELLLNSLAETSQLTTKNVLNLQNELGKEYQQGTISLEEYLTALEKLREIQGTPTGFSKLLLGMFSLTDATKESIDVLNELGETLEDLVQSAGLDLLSTSFEMIGASLAGVSDDAKTWEEAMAEIVAASLTSIGPALMSAGAQLLATPGGVANPLAWALLAAGAATSVGGGYISQSVANLAGGSSGETETASSQAVNFQDVNLEESGLNSSNSGDTSVIVNNNTSAEVSTRITEDGAGNRAVEFVIDSAVTKTARNYGLNKVPVNIA